VDPRLLRHGHHLRRGGAGPADPQEGRPGNIQGGPVYYITTAFAGGFGKFLAGFFAIAIILALGFFGCMVQSNSIGSTFQTAFGIPSWIVAWRWWSSAA
jgi:Na+/alanine symporter